VQIASTYDTARSWALTLGLNGGVKKMLNLSASTAFREQVGNQTELRSRYSLSRAITINYIFWRKFPNMQIQRKVVQELHSRIRELLSGAEPRWENFTATFGTRYVHAMTLGSLNSTMMRHSLLAEVASRLKGQDFSADVSATLDKTVKAGGKVDFRSEWQQKLGVTIESEDVESRSLGSEKDPMAIFFDLRPITDLLSPVFFAHNPVDRGQKYSPWVWYDLRESLSRHLTKLGVNQPLERGAADEFAPRLGEADVAFGCHQDRRSGNLHSQSLFCVVFPDCMGWAAAVQHASIHEAAGGNVLDRIGRIRTGRRSNSASGRRGGGGRGTGRPIRKSQVSGRTRRRRQLQVG
jgi:hypothetical protein